MINATVGDTLARITPPDGFHEGYSQSGQVLEVTDDTIVLLVQVDLPRRMSFRRDTGFDTAGIGSFIVRPDWNLVESRTA
jgi:hypothetical protein